MSTRISAVVVNFGQRELLQSCLESLRVALGRVEGTTEIVVVDNASPDGSAELVREDFPEARLVELSENTGSRAG